MLPALELHSQPMVLEMAVEEEAAVRGTVLIGNNQCIASKVSNHEPRDKTHSYWLYLSARM